MRRALLILSLAVLALLPSCHRRGGGVQPPEEQKDTVLPLGFRTEDFAVDSSKVSEGETFTGLMTRLGMGGRAAYELAENCKDVFDVRRMRAGNGVEGYYSTDTTGRRLEYAVYHNDRIRSTVFRCRDSLYASVYDKPVQSERKVADVSISSSLWNDMLAAGVSPLLIVDLADIYAWTVNFFGLQKDDRFRVIYDQTVCEGEVVKIDSIEFAIYDSGTFRACAIRFDQGDGGNKYWSEKGESLRKAFLKAPLKYNRISSRFTYHRKHPITGVVRPHTAVDYAAPVGTPVHSIGDGTVTMCGWDGSGGGNRIRIRHMNGYETCYMHLSKFASGIKAGARVAQGQTIGYVGSTGHSTGPHLDFRVWKDGTPIDPLKMISPPSEPLRKENIDSLGKVYAAFLKEFGE
ncbi:MAG: peptidoglycan DD-metalloendopeptidase family protein [Bacteroidales bacterium]|nr:peptidoglycan DD-metalloendopeptidase family protein [Bacteroidales bacterium]